MATYGPLPMARRLQQPNGTQEQELRAFRRALENEHTDLVALSCHSTAHSILTHAHSVLQGFSEERKLPAVTSAMVFALLWTGMGLTATSIDEVDLERKFLRMKGLTQRDVGKAKAFWVNALNFVNKFAVGS